MDKYVIVIVVNVILNHIWILPDVYIVSMICYWLNFVTSYSSFASKFHAPWVSNWLGHTQKSSLEWIPKFCSSYPLLSPSTTFAFSTSCCFDPVAMLAVGVEHELVVAIIFCRTSRIFSCKHTLLGKTSTCLVWNEAVAWLDGKRPSSWNNSITSCLRLSRVFLKLADRSPCIPAVLGVFGELAMLSEFSLALNTSGLKSGPKKVFPVRLDLGVETPVWGVLGVLGVADASDPRSSSTRPALLFM